MFDVRIKVGGSKIEKDIYRFVTEKVYDELVAVRGVGYPDDEIFAVFSGIADRAAHSLVGYFWLGGIRVCCNGKRFTVNGQVVLLVKSLVTGWVSQYKRGFAAWTSWDCSEPVIVLVVQDLNLNSCNEWCLGDVTVRILLFDGYNATAVINGEIMTVDILTLLAIVASYGFER